MAEPGTAVYPGVVVPAIPPPPPPLTLIASSIHAGGGSDPAQPWSVGDAQLALMPDDAAAELIARKGEAWVRGLRYAPENHYAGEVRDPCDFTSVDAKALPAPLEPNAGAGAKCAKATEEAGKGTLAAAAYEYKVTAVNANGETTSATAVKITLAAEGAIKLEWDKLNGAKYRVYGRLAGVFKLIAEVEPPTKESTQIVSYTDNGSITPAGASPPGTNTTGGVGQYTNLAIIEYVPFLILAGDQCSTFGFESRDFKGRALRLLDNVTPGRLEKEFWNGALARSKSYPNNYLAKEGAVEDLTPGTIPSVERGLAILQDALAQCGFGGQGMIHVQPQTTTSLLKVRRVGPLLLDIFDNIVVPGVGYPGTGPCTVGEPNGKAPKPGNAYMMATDMVMTRTEPDGTIFPDSFAQAMDWGQGSQPNTIRFTAQRYAAAYFDGACQFACEVELPK